jgi:hypothetical protein
MGNIIKNNIGNIIKKSQQYSEIQDLLHEIIRIKTIELNYILENDDYNYRFILQKTEEIQKLLDQLDCPLLPQNYDEYVLHLRNQLEPIPANITINEIIYTEAKYTKYEEE